MAYKVLARKWRPQTFDEITAQEHITTTLKNTIKSNRIGHAYLFSGPRGVGKTTTARILAKALNCEKGPTDNPCNQCQTCIDINNGSSLDVIEIDGASNNSVDDVRTLRENAKYAPSHNKKKIYIIDEVHMLSTSAFNALLKTLEEPPAHIIFIFATTDPHKVIPTILSRCQRFDFKRISAKEISNRLSTIVEQEKINITPDALLLIAKKADGGMRDALSFLDQIIAFTQGEEKNIIEVKDVIPLLGLVEQEIFFEFTSAIINKDSPSIIRLIAKIIEAGYDLHEFSLEFLDHLRNFLILKTDFTISDILEIPQTYIAEYQKQLSSFSIGDILRMIKIASEMEINLKRTSHPRILLEAGMIRLTKLDKTIELEELLKRIDNSDIESINKKKFNEPINYSVQSDTKLKDSNYIIKETSKEKEYSIEKIEPETVSTELEIPKTENAQSAKEIKDASTIDIDLDDLWHRIVNQVKTEKPLIGSCVERGIPLKLTDHSLIVSFSNKFDKEATEKLKKLIEDELYKIIKRSIKLDCKMNTETENMKLPEKNKEIKSSSVSERNLETKISASQESNINTKFKEIIDKEPTVKKIVEMFDGEIISIE